MCKYDLMQQSMVQFLANFGLVNRNIKCRVGVHIFHRLWSGRKFCMNLSRFELFVKDMDSYSLIGYQMVLLQLYLINKFECGLQIIEKYKYVILRKVKLSKLVITTWKLPYSKVYHGLNNALGIWVHEKHYQVLPTQMVPISALAHGLFLQDSASMVLFYSYTLCEVWA